MKLATSALLLVLASCASEEPSAGGGANPPMLWLAMNTGGSQMQLVAEEPHPY